MTAALHVVELRFLAFKRLWRGTLMLSFLQPLLFLVGMGVGVGALVNRNTAGSDVLGGVEYLAFLAPALMATTAMMSAVNESLWPVMDSFTWTRAYDAMVASPLDAREVLTGEIAWWALRLTLTTSAIAVVLAVLPATRSWGLLPAVPCAVLCGLAFGVPLAAWSATRETDQSFPAINRFIVTPLFLFGGAFYPIDNLPAAVRPVARVTPLWHGVELCRGLSLHTIGALAVLVHVAVLLAYVAVGWVIAHRTYAKKLHR